MNRELVFVLLAACVVATFFSCRTSTASPTSDQVAYSREWLSIRSDLSIEPKGYAIKPGMDYMVRFVFVAETDDQAMGFNPTTIDAGAFAPGFEFGPGESHMTESWWDHASHDLTGARVWVPTDDFWLLQQIGFYENSDGTLTVYVWRH